MENQHHHIKGYRDLSPEEIALMNEIKVKGEELRELIGKVRPIARMVPRVLDEFEADHPEYWVRTADSYFRSGVMALVRAVAQPTSY